MDFTDEERAIYNAPVNIDLLPHVVQGAIQGVGVRVRPYGRDYPKDIMVMGYGASVAEALAEVYALAAANRWEKLDWSARPWGVPSTGSTGGFGPPTKGRTSGPAPF